MSKTNHRIYKDREERLPEPKAHKSRRGFKTKVSTLVEQYDGDLETLYDEFDDDTEYAFEKIKRKK